MTEYFSRPKSSGGRVKVELDLSNNATEEDFRNATGVDISDFDASDLPNLKPHIDKLDIDKLKIVPSTLSYLKNKVDKFDVFKSLPVPVDLSKLSEVVEIMMSLKKMNIMLRSKILKIEYLILLT